LSFAVKPEQITAAAIAQCGGMTAARRNGWVKHGLRAKPPFSEFDAIETAVAREISDSTTQKRATTAFRHLNVMLKKALLAGHTKLWAIVPATGYGFRLEASPAKTLKIASQAEGSLWIVALEGPISEAKKRYSEYVSEIGGSEKGVLHAFPASEAGEAN
jgi:hypothetical protein